MACPAVSWSEGTESELFSYSPPAKPKYVCEALVISMSGIGTDDDTFETVKVAVPVCPLNTALMLAVPFVTAEVSPGSAWPADCTVATRVFEEVQVAEVVTSCDDPSL